MILALFHHGKRCKRNRKLLMIKRLQQTKKTYGTPENSNTLMKTSMIFSSLIEKMLSSGL